MAAGRDFEKTTPRSGPGPVITSSRARTSPVDGVAKPAIMFSIVDLPEPEGPSKETNSPSLIDTEVSPMIVVGP